MKADGSDWNAENLVNRKLDFGVVPDFRLLLKHAILEFYQKDILIDCYSLPAEASGKIGLIQEAEQNTITNLNAWQMSLPNLAGKEIISKVL